jgi:hypothetical protein
MSFSRSRLVVFPAVAPAFGVGTALLAPKTDRLKARSNGEDIITPLVAKAADAVATAVARK